MKSTSYLYLHLKEITSPSSENTPWYKGPDLVEALNAFSAPEKPTNLPLRVPVQDVYSITGVGTVPVGRVETGIMKKGENIIFEPPGAGRSKIHRDAP